MTPGAKVGLSLVSTFIAASLLLVLHRYIEETEFGRVLLRSSQELLIDRMWARRPDPVHTFVIDTSDLPYSSDGVPEGREAVPDRQQILACLTELVKRHPRAIGVDIDFSSREGGLLTTRDPAFFEQVRELSQGVPIFLGAASGIPSGRSKAIGSVLEAQTVCICTPADSDGLIATDYQPGGGAKPIPGMSAAMAACSSTKPPANSLVSFFEKCGLVQSHSRESSPIGEFTLSPVDYSMVDELEQNVVSYNDLADLDKHLNPNEDTYFVLGDFSRPEIEDVFPTYGAKLAPGVVLHAAALETLAYKPLYRVTGRGDILVDLLLSLMFVGASCFYAIRRADDEEEERLVMRRILLIGIAVVVGITLANTTTRVIWLSSWVVIAAICLHHPLHQEVQHRLKPGLKAAGKRPSTSLNRISDAAETPAPPKQEVGTPE